ncbi:septal junction protein FraD [Brasilonema octagenarum]|uniref:DUF5357 domain-containing protein n=1 Tax=Brasilonema octagenarum UFV-OR1 TaxID=417115 RepID=A0ABX1M1N3_9CYAN|nr:septal junction protein FraD [Brasilonema octagenarum]NMF62403.1 hypothetical protein [Brasilonema octagenarum UFV-OR1]
MQLIRDAFGLFGIVESVYERIKNFLIPPKAYSWQTLIYLSLFSWLMSSLALGLVKDLIAFCGWLFLIFGTAWYTTDNPLYVPGTNLPIGALITGFLVSVFAFGYGESVLTTRTIVLWPTISAIITAIPEFFEGSGVDAKTLIPKIEDRQKMIILVGSCMVISCWLQFFFLTQNWLKQYPSLTVDNYQKSAFVTKTVSTEKIPQNGVLILDKISPKVEDQLRGKPWSEAEQWLFNARRNVGDLGKEVINKELVEYEERFLWHVEPRVSNVKGGGYKLDLLSIWDGPSSNARGYYLEKSCRVDPVLTSGSTSSQIVRKTENKDAIAETECGSKISFFAGSPPPQQ